MPKTKSSKKWKAFKGAHQEGYWIPIFRKKIGHISKSRGKIFDFPDPESSYTSSRRVFCSRMRALFQTVRSEQFPKKIVP